MSCPAPRRPAQPYDAHLPLVGHASAKQPNAEADVVRILHLLPIQLLFARPRQLQSLVSLRSDAGQVGQEEMVTERTKGRKRIICQQPSAENRKVQSKGGRKIQSNDDK